MQRNVESQWLLERRRHRPTAMLLLAVAGLVATPIRGQAAGPTVHILNEVPDDERGVVKLARHRGTTTQAAVNATVVTTHYEELCALPCGGTVDVTERPIFFLVRDQEAVSYGFRLPETGEVTLSIRPRRRTMALVGAMLAGFNLYPIGVPLWVLGAPRVSISDGPPTAGQTFKKVRRAKT